MTVVVAILCGVSGLAIGSFLNVVIWRVPRGESVVSPPSACPKCQSRIRAYDNIPIFSWLILRGACRDCGAPISLRYPLVEAATGVGFALVGAWLGASWLLPAFLYLMAITVALTMIDIDVRRLPDQIVLPSYLILATLLAGAALALQSPQPVGRAFIAAAIMFALYFVVCVAYPGGMGFGDVKLAGVLGLALGFLGWKELATGAFLAFMVGGLVGIALMLAGRRRVKVPFGPYMLLGAWLGVFVGPTLADWYLRVAQLA